MTKKEEKLLVEWNKRDVLSQDQKDQFVGNLLGDGHIRVQKGTASMRYGYGLPNVLYAFYVWSCLGPLLFLREPRRFESTDPRYNNKVRVSWVFNTISTTELFLLAMLFTTPLGVDSHIFVKTLPSYEVLFDLITPRALAFWIMDDGMYTKRAGLTLCTDGFTLEEVERLRKVIENKFGFSSTIHRKRNIKKDPNKIYFRIYISCAGDKRDRFRQLVAPHMHPSMMYKLDY